MLSEIILDEERSNNYLILTLGGIISVLSAFIITQHFFPGQVSFLIVIAAAIPLIYPLMSYFLEVEKEDHVEKGVTAYLSIFAGQVIAFALLAYLSPQSFEYQIAEFQTVLSTMGIDIGITGYATNTVSFTSILLNNLSIFLMISVLALVIGSAGAFILTWNASVLGAFFGILTSELPKDMSLILGAENTPSPIAYMPHATLELTGFIIAGLVGTTASAAIYRQHFSLKHWKDLTKLYLLGIIAVIGGAFIETV